jgi:AraC-like DNA-binding protein
MHTHAIHSHGAYSVISVTSGAKRFHHNGTEHLIQSGELAISNPGDLHGCEPADSEPWSHRTWYVSAELAAELARPFDQDRPVLLSAPVIKDSALAERLNAAHEESRRGDVLDRQSAALDALAALFDAHLTTPRPALTDQGIGAATRVARCETIIEARLATGLDLTVLSTATAVSCAQVIRDFRRIRGITPGAFLRQLRVVRARELIRSGESFASIANALGFADQSHFTRSFRDAFGVTPSAFRELAESAKGNPAF